ncbi:MAG: SpoIID/LytB domain-containing protein [Bacteroidales bacterium]
MKRNLFLVLLVLLITPRIMAQVIRIGLYHDEVVESVVINCTEGEYLIKDGEARIGEFKKGDMLFATLKKDSIRLHNSSRVFGTFEFVELKSLSLDGTFRIRPVIPALASRSYDDDLIIDSKSNFLNIVNQVDFDKYIAGVLESEVGPNTEKELYKAHALMTRTYLLKNFEKHKEEGFSLCDGIHCQAYHGRATFNPEIAKAVYETTGEVVTDFHYKLITAVYHSNSGGETQRAADVWLKDTDYLQAVIDPYSLHQPNAKWYDTIFFSDWKTYLLEKGMESVKKIPDELLYVQQRHRRKYFVLDRDSLLMTTIREDWGFKSTFFNMFPEVGDRIVLWGKGYGHGVGLSQEGAMNMARSQLNYQDIIKFYFFNIRIMHHEDLPRSSLPDISYPLP